MMQQTDGTYENIYVWKDRWNNMETISPCSVYLDARTRRKVSQTNVKYLNNIKTRLRKIDFETVFCTDQDIFRFKSTSAIRINANATICFFESLSLKNTTPASVIKTMLPTLEQG